MRYKSILILLLPLTIFCQTRKVSDLSNIENEWLNLTLDWSYHKGDNITWAQPNFDDSSWKKFSNFNLNIGDSTVIANKNEIAWFRKYIKVDRPINDDFVLDVIQQGASEIYLDGELIHKLGTVSTDPDKIINKNPWGTFLRLPLVQGKEQVLAVRYVNSQYKYPKNKRIANTNGFIGLRTTAWSNANASRVLSLTDSLLTNQWTTITNFWRYQKGDDPNWAKPDVDDSSWAQSTAWNLNEPDAEPIASNNEIVWFRRPIKIDSAFRGAAVLRIWQNAASEIYLDGKRIHKLGTVSTHPDSVVRYNPWRSLLSLPVIPGKEQLLAIRFASAESKYPIYRSFNPYIRLQLASFDLANANGPEQDTGLIRRQKEVNNSYVVLGVGLFMCVLFLSYFLFFTNEKINGYFALSSLLFSLFMIGIIFDNNELVYSFRIDFFYGFFAILYILSTLFCIYIILNSKLGAFFWGVSILLLSAIPLLFLFSPGYIGPIAASLGMIEILRIGIKALKTERVGALIFISSAGINLLFWLFIILDRLDILSLDTIDYYQPFIFAIVPLSIAIYLGFVFGKRSKSLRLKLAEVEQLSQEKEQILSTQNVTLEKQVKERTASLKSSLDDLKATQNQLIQSEKMASLGELTAGIAHEIQNPLNFVNNFSEVSTELIDEMNEEIKKKDYEEVKAIAGDIKQNLDKINHHGKRADGIVKGMLQHSRTSSGEKELTDLNVLADEYLRLAYHGLRAKDKTFNATLDTHFDESIGKVNVLAQDMGRVILNLITNAFYVVKEKSSHAKASEDSKYMPTVTVSTKKSKAGVEIRVKDNGNGIPEEIKEKIFEPFFTTKPTGQGTGLGLSMSYDIVTKGHGGSLSVETEEGKGTEFIITLPMHDMS